MPVTDPTGTTVVELSRAEQWVVHHVLLAELGLADGRVDDADQPSDPDDASLAVIEKLEAGSFEFTPSELELLRHVCDNHARSTEATADRNLAGSVVDRIEMTLRETEA